jgi:hypothetical protein
MIFPISVSQVVGIAGVDHLAYSFDYFKTGGSSDEVTNSVSVLLYKMTIHFILQK